MFGSLGLAGAPRRFPKNLIFSFTDELYAGRTVRNYQGRKIRLSKAFQHMGYYRRGRATETLDKRTSGIRDLIRACLPAQL